MPELQTLSAECTRVITRSNNPTIYPFMNELLSVVKHSSVVKAMI